MPKSLDHQLAFITGGSSGIGLALAKQFARRGANVWIAARHMEQLFSAQKEIEAVRMTPAQQVGILQLDVANKDQIAVVAEELLSKAGVPDYVVNSAGVVHPGEFLNLDLARFEWMMDINYFGTVYIIRALLPALVKRGSGHIVNISSSAGFVGVYGYTAYCASKFAVRGFSDALRSEVKNCGIQVSLVFPPDTDTPQFAYEEPIKPAITKEVTKTTGLMSPDQVAQKILQGVDAGRYIILPGLINRLTYFLVNLLGVRWYTLMDWMVNDARRKVGPANDKACECRPDDRTQL